MANADSNELQAQLATKIRKQQNDIRNALIDNAIEALSELEEENGFLNEEVCETYRERLNEYLQSCAFGEEEPEYIQIPKLAIKPNSPLASIIRTPAMVRRICSPLIGPSSGISAEMIFNRAGGIVPGWGTAMLELAMLAVTVVLLYANLAWSWQADTGEWRVKRSIITASKQKYKSVDILTLGSIVLQSEIRRMVAQSIITDTTMQEYFSNNPNLVGKPRARRQIIIPAASERAARLDLPEEMEEDDAREALGM